MGRHTTVIQLSDPSQVGEARRTAVLLAGRAGASEEAQSQIALVVTEAARNVLVHGGGGELLVQGIERDGAVGVEVVAIDRGRGMRDLGQCLRDGFSTAGTAGEGLGAIRRSSHAFDVYTAEQQGTVLLSRIWLTPPPDPMAFEVGTVQVPFPGEEVCGDSWGFFADGGRARLLVSDGLGHGAGAAGAASEAERLFHAHASQRPAEVLKRMHDAMRSTRGAAVALCDLDAVTGGISYAGVGNIVSVAVAPPPAARQNMVSLNGTIGHQVRAFQEFTYQLAPGALVAMHSDGLSTHWALEKYPGLLARDPAVVAAVLYRDFWRKRDDVTVLVARRTGRAR